MTRVEAAVWKGARWVAPVGAVLALCVLAAAAVAALPLPRPTTVTTHQTKRGKDLAAANGHALYLSSAEISSTSKCYGSCAGTWKPLLTSGHPVAEAGSGVNAKLLGTTRRSDHTLQVTYKGHPLYTFTKDTRAGEINGEGANKFGAHWYIVNTAGNSVKPKSSQVCNGLCQGY